MSDTPDPAALRALISRACEDALEMTLDQALAYPRGDETSDLYKDIAAALDALVAALASERQRADEAVMERDLARTARKTWANTTQLAHDELAAARAEVQRLRAALEQVPLPATDDRGVFWDAWEIAQAALNAESGGM